MKQFILLFSALLLISLPVLAQEEGKYHIGHETKIHEPVPGEGMIKGSVHALHYLEHLADAQIDLKSDKHERQVDTDKHGHFEFEIEPGTYVLTVSYKGFDAIVVKDVVVSDGHESHINIGLVETMTEEKKE